VDDPAREPNVIRTANGLHLLVRTWPYVREGAEGLAGLILSAPFLGAEMPISGRRAALDADSKLALPFLIFHGDADLIASVSTTRRFFPAARSPHKTLAAYGDLLHEVLNELGKERVGEAVASRLDAHGAARGGK